MKYSQADLLGEELFLLSGKATWQHKILYRLARTKKVPLTIHVPHTYLSRAYADDDIRGRFRLFL